MFEITKLIIPKTNLVVVEATCRCNGSKVIHYDGFSFSLAILINLLMKNLIFNVKI